MNVHEVNNLRSFRVHFADDTSHLSELRLPQLVHFARTGDTRRMTTNVARSCEMDHLEHPHKFVVNKLEQPEAGP